MSLLRFPSKKEIAKLARSKFVRGVGVCVRSHHFALYDDPLGWNIVKLFSDAFRDEVADFFQKVGVGHSAPEWYSLRLGWWPLFQHISAIIATSIKCL